MRRVIYFLVAACVLSQTTVMAEETVDGPVSAVSDSNVAVPAVNLPAPPVASDADSSATRSDDQARWKAWSSRMKSRSKQSLAPADSKVDMRVVESYFKGMYERQAMDHDVEDATLDTLNGIFETQKNVVDKEATHSKALKKIIDKQSEDEEVEDVHSDAMVELLYGQDEQMDNQVAQQKSIEKIAKTQHKNFKELENKVDTLLAAFGGAGVVRSRKKSVDVVIDGNGNVAEDGSTQAATPATAKTDDVNVVRNRVLSEVSTSSTTTPTQFAKPLAAVLGLIAVATIVVGAVARTVIVWNRGRSQPKESETQVTQLDGPAENLLRTE